MYTTYIRQYRFILIGLFTTMLLVSQSGASALSSVEPGVPPEARAFLIDPTVPITPEPIPSDPTETLVNAITAVSNGLGVSVDPNSAISSAGLSDELAGRLALVLQDLSECQQVSRRALQSIDIQQVTEETGPSLDNASIQDIRSCALNLDQSSMTLQQFLSPPPEDLPPSGIDLWPVLRLEVGDDNNQYLHDYVLSVDLAGNDFYNNNAGGNLIDVLRGPEGSVALTKAPARGCQQVLPDFLSAQCVLAASVFLDLSGNDTYGLLETPEADVRCTQDLLVRRHSTQGVGFVGVGILIDAGGNDHYVGRTITQGSGHLGGLGILRDFSATQEGQTNDHYLAIRNAQGAALNEGALGIAQDVGGNDVYDFYMPAGGIISDLEVCDDRPRHVQGASAVGGVGVMINKYGDDHYRSDIRSQGFGTIGGTGVFLDQIGWDVYEGPMQRTNDSLVLGDPFTLGVGIFRDDPGSL